MFTATVTTSAVHTQQSHALMMKHSELGGDSCNYYNGYYYKHVLG